MKAKRAAQVSALQYVVKFWGDSAVKLPICLGMVGQRFG
jgi:hypothetical protein